ncbi:MAG: hypothetical protein AAF502_18040 [Bacteroidota bacterium]
MEFLYNIWEKIKGSPSVLYPTFQIRTSNILDQKVNIGNPILPRERYFEITLTEQFLQNKREYWNEFIPLTLFFSEFIYAGERNTFPFVVGPKLLKSREQLDGKESIRYKNTRVCGPTPYRGDNVSLFTGLFRVKTKDWAAQTINFLETVATAFDTSQLTGYLSVAKPIISGIESFFDMGKEMQFRIGQRDEFRDPTIHTTNQFRSGYWVMIRKDQDQIKKENFWVKDGELFIGTSRNNIKPYVESDYTLFEINGFQKRGDYETFEFHKNWQKVHKLVIQKNGNEAAVEFQNLMVNLYSNHDIIALQKNQLAAMYSGLFEEAKKVFLQQSPRIELSKSLLLNQNLLNDTGITVEFDPETIDITQQFIKDTSPRIHNQNFEIDEQFIEDSLDNPILKNPKLLEMKATKLGNFNPLIDLINS